MAELEQITDALCYHGEGPVWSPTWGGLRWVDMLAGDVLTLRADGSVDRLHVGDVAAFVRPRTRGGWVVATERGLARADEPDGIPAPWIELWDDPSIRMNEGGVDSLGRLWCGSMGYDRVPGSATLYRVDADGHVVTVLPDVTISNGIDLSPDHRLAYYNDTPSGRTDVFDVDDGELTRRRPFVTHDDRAPGRPHRRQRRQRVGRAQRRRSRAVLLAERAAAHRDRAARPARDRMHAGRRRCS